MKTLKKLNPGKSLVLFAALGLVSTVIAAPAFADHSNGSRTNRTYENNNGYNNGYGNRGYRNNTRNQYARLDRINRYGVRGKIIKYGRGTYRECFRVKRSGKYQREAAIVTVRYCLDPYGDAKMVRGSKQLVRYMGYYRPARGYNYRAPTPRRH